MSGTLEKSALGIDFGLKRIGLAYGQFVTRSARPLKPISAQDGKPDWNALVRLVDEWQPDAIVVGLPLNMDGTISEMAYRARKFANRLSERVGSTVYLHDERLTSQEAKQIHIEQGGHRDFGQHSVDGLAAQLMLESWMNCTTRIPSHKRLEELYE